MVYNYDHDGGDERRVKPVDEDALGTVVANGRHDQLVTPPFVAELRNNSTVRGVDQALSTVTAGGGHHGLTVPDGAFIQKHHGGVDYSRIEHMVKSIREPLPALVARVNTSLVIPYRRGARAYGAAARPLHTLSTHDSGALVEPDFTDAELDDMVLNSRFRMLGPREHLRAQRFPDSYEVRGNKSEQTKGAGNAVASNVAHYIGVLVGQALGTPLERAA
jgi:DNA (cytosine-5)-methyltransferase 1